MTYAGLISAIFVAIDASLIPTLWAVCAFRAGDMPPDSLRMLNDIAWFMFLFRGSLAVVCGLSPLVSPSFGIKVLNLSIRVGWVSHPYGSAF